MLNIVFAADEWSIHYISNVLINGFVQCRHYINLLNIFHSIMHIIFIKIVFVFRVFHVDLKKKENDKRELIRCKNNMQ